MPPRPSTLALPELMPRWLLSHPQVRWHPHSCRDLNTCAWAVGRLDPLRLGLQVEHAPNGHALSIPLLTSLPWCLISVEQFAQFFPPRETASFVRGTSLLVKTAGHQVDPFTYPILPLKLEGHFDAFLEADGHGLKSCQGRSEVPL